VREFIASEALAALGIPTTRALSLVTTGAKVLRDMFYKCAERSCYGATECVTPATSTDTQW
jgi:serine/tyrosine/threonine adenylyltransferase